MIGLSLRVSSFQLHTPIRFRTAQRIFIRSPHRDLSVYNNDPTTTTATTITATTNKPDHHLAAPNNVMSFSSRRRNYLLTPHRRDGLIEWMKSMLQHSFVLDALETTAVDTFRHFEILIEEHRALEKKQKDERGNLSLSSSMIPSSHQMSRLRQLVPTIGSFHTSLPLAEAFEIYNEKHRLTKRKHIQISFNEIRHILNLAQVIALRKHPTKNSRSDVLHGGRKKHDESPETLAEKAMLSSKNSMELDLDPKLEERTLDENIPPGKLNGPSLITFDGDQTLYSDGSNFEGNPRLAYYLYQLLRHGVAVAVVTAAGYEYNVEKYEYRLSGLLSYFRQRGLTKEESNRFYLFGGECNYLLQLREDYHLHPVNECGPGGWCTTTKYLPECPGNWSEAELTELLDVSERTMQHALEELNLRARIIRKPRSVGLVPLPGCEIPRESLDETVLLMHEKIQQINQGQGPRLPYCAFNGGTDAWVDVGNKRVGVQVLQAYLGVDVTESLHIGDQFLNTGNDFAARDVSPCIWIINPQETTYILKSILRLAGVSVTLPEQPQSSMKKGDDSTDSAATGGQDASTTPSVPSNIDFAEIERRREAASKMDVYTGEMNPTTGT